MYNSKEIVDLEGFFILSVSYVDMTTYPATKYYFIIERLYVIYRLLVLIISTFSFLLFLYTISWRYKRDYLHARIDILLCIILYIINTMKKHYKLFLCLVRTYDTKKVPISTCPPTLPPQPSIHSYVREKSGGVFLGRLLSFTEDIFIGHLTPASRLLL